MHDYTGWHFLMTATKMTMMMMMMMMMMGIAMGIKLIRRMCAPVVSTHTHTHTWFTMLIQPCVMTPEYSLMQILQQLIFQWKKLSLKRIHRYMPFLIQLTDPTSHRLRIAYFLELLWYLHRFSWQPVWVSLPSFLLRSVVLLVIIIYMFGILSWHLEADSEIKLHQHG